MKSGWKKLLGNRDEDQREQEEAEEKELQELTDLAQQIPALQEINLNAELNISIPDEIIFGDDSHMSEESEEEVQETKKKLSSEQLTEINHHVECLENIISQFDPDESRANRFLCQLQEMTKPYQALLALRNQLKVQPKITSFMKVKTTDIKEPTKTGNKHSLETNSSDTEDDIVQEIEEIEEIEENEEIVEIIEIKEDKDIKKDQRPKDSERTLEKELPFTPACLPSYHQMPKNSSIKDICSGYHFAIESQMCFKNLKLHIELRMIWGNCHLHDGSYDTSIQIQEKYKQASFGQLTDEFHLSRGGAMYIVTPEESVGVKHTKDYMVERKVGLIGKLKLSPDANVSSALTITYNCSLFS